jgi:hypothetical protein
MAPRGNMDPNRTPSQADRIRQFAVDHYVGPARAEGRAQVTIRAGDVHQAMGLTNALPAVCSAIGSNKFGQLAGVTLVTHDGPANGANVYFQFSLGSTATSEVSTVPPSRSFLRPTPSRPRSNIDLNDSVVLVSCVKSKPPHPAPARSLYTSTWFRKTRDIVEGSGARWFVLSSLYGLVAPDAEIAPYDYTLNSVGIPERRQWAKNVLDKLLAELAGGKRVVMFAGKRYREFLLEPLERRGIKVDIPMERLTRGEQLAWLSEHR